MKTIKIEKKKEYYKEQMESYNLEVRTYIETYGNDNSEYLIHRRLMSQYYRGCVNALIELLK